MNCPTCGKSVPESNLHLHSLHCSRQTTQMTREPSAHKVKATAAKKKHPSVKSRGGQSDDLDAMLAEMSLMDSLCGFQGCRKNVNLLGLQCQFCHKRFCMEHTIPEVHGCADAAKKHARQVVKPRQASHSNVAKRAQLQKKLDSKLEQFSSGRRSKVKSRSKKGKSWCSCEQN